MTAQWITMLGTLATALGGVIVAIVKAAAAIVRAYGREEAARVACEKEAAELRATVARFGARLQAMERDHERRAAVERDREVTGARRFPLPPGGGHGR